MTNMEKVCEILDKAAFRFIKELDTHHELQYLFLREGILTPLQMDDCYRSNNTVSETNRLLMQCLRHSPLASYKKLRKVLKEHGYADFVNECLLPVGEVEPVILTNASMSSAIADSAYESRADSTEPHLFMDVEKTPLRHQNEQSYTKFSTDSDAEDVSNLMDLNLKVDFNMNDEEMPLQQHLKRNNSKRTFNERSLNSQQDQICSLNIPDMDHHYRSLFVANSKCERIVEVNRKRIQAVTKLSGKVYVVDELHQSVPTILVFDIETSGEFCQQNDIILTESNVILWDISACQLTRRLYIADSGNSCIWTVRQGLTEFMLGEPKRVLDANPNINLSLTIVGELLMLCNLTKTLRVIEPVNHTDKYNISLPKHMLGLQHAVETSLDCFMISYGLANFSKHQVSEVNKNGQVLRSFGNDRGSDTFTLDCPIHMAIDEERKDLYVCDNARVLVLDLLSFKNGKISLKCEINLINGRPTRVHYTVETGLIIGLDNGDLIKFSGEKCDSDNDKVVICKRARYD